MKTLVDIRLLGQKISLKTAGDPASVREVVDFVSTRIEEAQKRTKNLVPHHIALLALLDLAEDYLQAKRSLSEHQLAIKEKTEKLIEQIEAELK